MTWTLTMIFKPLGTVTFTIKKALFMAHRAGYAFKKRAHGALWFFQRKNSSEASEFPSGSTYEVGQLQGKIHLSNSLRAFFGFLGRKLRADSARPFLSSISFSESYVWG